jgi:hypothetical protein
VGPRGEVGDPGDEGNQGVCVIFNGTFNKYFYATKLNVYRASLGVV